MRTLLTGMRMILIQEMLSDSSALAT